MFDYVGARCPYCDQQFKNGDDIAVCPVCGTPHHRACYAERGACAAVLRHGENFDWQAAERAKKKAESATIRCPGCGCGVVPGSRFCNQCGRAFGEPVARQPAAGVHPAAQDSGTRADRSLGGLRSEYYETVLQSLSETQEFDGIALRDWMVYIGSGAPYYLGYFKIQDETNRKIAFTFSAMLMPVVYFAYRKLWAVAGAALASGMLLALPYAAATFHEYGVITLADPDFWARLSGVFSYVGLAVNFLWGAFAVRLYRNGAARQIRRIRLKSADEADYRARLSRASGPSAVAVTIVLGAILLLAALAAQVLPGWLTL